ncbi:MAG: BadF/BadG/BcrA/BcrD ATPase family protein [Pirellula sp.]
MDHHDSVGQRWLLGVDGGGTKTSAWIAVVEGMGSVPKLRVTGQGNAGPSNPRSVGFDVAIANLSLAIDAAKKRASLEGVPLAIACLGLAGAGRSEEQQKILAWATSQSLAAETIVVDDVEPLALAAEYQDRYLRDDSIGHPREPDVKVSWEQSVTLVAGTGSIACGKNTDGQRARVGGWGYLLGDEGSGFAIGLAGLQAICRAHDGSGPKTVLSSILLDRLELESPIQLVGYLYQSILPRDSVAKLAENVISSAFNDPVASSIVSSAIDSLVNLVRSVVQKLRLAKEAYSLALSGGVLSHHQCVIDALMVQLKNAEISPRDWQLVREPTYGPLIIAATRNQSCAPGRL